MQLNLILLRTKRSAQQTEARRKHQRLSQQAEGAAPGGQVAHADATDTQHDATASMDSSAGEQGADAAAIEEANTATEDVDTAAVSEVHIPSIASMRSSGCAASVPGASPTPEPSGRPSRGEGATSSVDDAAAESGQVETASPAPTSNAPGPTGSAAESGAGAASTSSATHQPHATESAVRRPVPYRREAPSRLHGTYIVRSGRASGRVMSARDMQSSVARLYSGRNGPPEAFDMCASP